MDPSARQNLFLAFGGIGAAVSTTIFGGAMSTLLNERASKTPKALLWALLALGLAGVGASVLLVAIGTPEGESVAITFLLRDVPVMIAGLVIGIGATRWRKSAIDKLKIDNSNAIASVQARANQDKADNIKAEINRPIDSFLSVDLSVNVIQNMGINPATYHRDGGPGLDYFSVQFEIRLINYGQYHVKPNSIKSLHYSIHWVPESSFTEQWAPWDHSDSKPVTKSAWVEPCAIDKNTVDGIVIHVEKSKREEGGNVTVHSDGPPPSTAQFGILDVHATLMIAGEWGQEERPLDFKKKIPIPIAIKYATAIDTAVPKIKDGLEAKGATLTWANVTRVVGSSDSWDWNILVGTLAPMKIRVVADTIEEACGRAAIEKIVNETMDKLANVKP